MDGPFYMVLPSNSGSYPNNRICRYRTKLPMHITFNGKWECGVVNVMYTHSWNKIGEDENVFLVHLSNGDVLAVDIPKFEYIDIRDLEKDLNANIKQAVESMYSKRSKRELKTPTRKPVKVKDNTGGRIYQEVPEEDRLYKGVEIVRTKHVPIIITEGHPGYESMRKRYERPYIETGGELLMPSATTPSATTPSATDPAEQEEEEEAPGEYKMEQISVDDAFHLIRDKIIRELVRDSDIIHDNHGRLLVFPKNTNQKPFTVKLVFQENPEKLLTRGTRAGRDRIEVMQRVNMKTIRRSIIVQLMPHIDTNLKNGVGYYYYNNSYIVFPKTGYQFEPIVIKDGVVYQSDTSLVGFRPFMRNDSSDEEEEEDQPAPAAPPTEPDAPKKPVEEPVTETTEAPKVLPEHEGHVLPTNPPWTPKEPEDSGYEGDDESVETRHDPEDFQDVREPYAGPRAKYSEPIVLNESKVLIGEGAGVKRPAESAPVDELPRKKIKFDDEFIAQAMHKIRFVFKKNDTRFFFSAPDDIVKYVVLPNKFSYMLGFSSSEKLRPNTLARYTPDIRAGIHRFCVYENSGLTQLMIFGDRMTSLLRVVPVTAAPGTSKEETFNPPMFKRIIAKSIEDIEIEVKTMDNEYVPFNYGEFIVTLAFRPAY